MIDASLALVARLTPWQAAGWLLLLNLVQFALSLALGAWAARRFPIRVAPAPGPIARDELWLAGARCSTSFVLLAAMDLLMYGLHRIAHAPRIFALVHGTHHRYVNPRPLDLFALSPLEVLGFGALWLFVMWIHPATWAAVLIYLTLNLAFGTLGHLGVEPFPGAPRWVGSSTFHAGHHANRDTNFGFYTSAWDWLCGTRQP